MKKIILGLIVLVLVGCGSERETKRENEEKDALIKVLEEVGQVIEENDMVEEQEVVKEKEVVEVTEVVNGVKRALLKRPIYIHFNKVYYYEDKPFNGIRYNVWTKGKLKKEITYKYGICEGLYKEWNSKRMEFISF